MVDSKVREAQTVKHGTKKLHPPMYEDFEIRRAKEKGLGAFATRPIKAGTIILHEEPLFIIRKPWDRITETDVCDEYSKLSIKGQATFDNLRDSKAELGQNPRKKKIYKFFANKFAVGQQPSYGCFAVSSRFNHSCLPNSAITSAEGKPTFKVIIDVKQGQELTFAYVDSLQYMHTEQRQTELKRINVHDCKCKLCCSPPIDRVVSDMRRGLLRALLFMVRGQDLAFGSSMATHLNKDVYIEDAALHWLLIAMLAEAEGLVAGEVPYTSWANATRMLLCKSLLQNNTRFPTSLISNARTWMDKSEGLLRRFSVAPLESSTEWIALRQFVDAVGPHGEMPAFDTVLIRIMTLPAGMRSKGI